VKLEQINCSYTIVYHNFLVRLLLLYTIIYEQFTLIISNFTFYKKKTAKNYFVIIFYFFLLFNLYIQTEIIYWEEKCIWTYLVYNYIYLYMRNFFIGCMIKQDEMRQLLRSTLIFGMWSRYNLSIWAVIALRYYFFCVVIYLAIRMLSAIILQSACSIGSLKWDTVIYKGDLNRRYSRILNYELC